MRCGVGERFVQDQVHRGRVVVGTKKLVAGDVHRTHSLVKVHSAPSRCDKDLSETLKIMRGEFVNVNVGEVCYFVEER